MHCLFLLFLLCESSVFYVSVNGSGNACSVDFPCLFTTIFSKISGNSNVSVYLYAGQYNNVDLGQFNEESVSLSIIGLQFNTTLSFHNPIALIKSSVYVENLTIGSHSLSEPVPFCFDCFQSTFFNCNIYNIFLNTTGKLLLHRCFLEPILLASSKEIILEHSLIKMHPGKLYHELNYKYYISATTINITSTHFNFSNSYDLFPPLGIFISTNFNSLDSNFTDFYIQNPIEKPTIINATNIIMNKTLVTSFISNEDPRFVFALIQGTNIWLNSFHLTYVPGMRIIGDKVTITNSDWYNLSLSESVLVISNYTIIDSLSIVDSTVDRPIFTSYYMDIRNSRFENLGQYLSYESFSTKGISIRFYNSTFSHIYYRIMSSDSLQFVDCNIDMIRNLGEGAISGKNVTFKNCHISRSIGNFVTATNRIEIINSKISNGNWSEFGFLINGSSLFVNNSCFIENNVFYYAPLFRVSDFSSIIIENSIIQRNNFAYGIFFINDYCGSRYDRNIDIFNLTNTDNNLVAGGLLYYYIPPTCFSFQPYALNLRNSVIDNNLIYGPISSSNPFYIKFLHPLYNLTYVAPETNYEVSVVLQDAFNQTIIDQHYQHFSLVLSENIFISKSISNNNGIANFPKVIGNNSIEKPSSNIIYNFTVRSDDVERVSNTFYVKFAKHCYPGYYFQQAGDTFSCLRCPDYKYSFGVKECVNCPVIESGKSTNCIIPLKGHYSAIEEGFLPNDYDYPEFLVACYWENISICLKTYCKLEECELGNCSVVCQSCPWEDNYSTLHNESCQNFCEFGYTNKRCAQCYCNIENGVDCYYRTESACLICENSQWYQWLVLTLVILFFFVINFFTASCPNSIFLINLIAAIIEILIILVLYILKYLEPWFFVLFVGCIFMVFISTLKSDKYHSYLKSILFFIQAAALMGILDSLVPTLKKLSVTLQIPNIQINGIECLFKQLQPGSYQRYIVEAMIPIFGFFIVSLILFISDNYRKLVSYIYRSFLIQKDKNGKDEEKLLFEADMKDNEKWEIGFKDLPKSISYDTGNKLFIDQCKHIFLLVCYVCFFKIQHSISEYLICEEDYVKEFPWIQCDNSEYRILYILSVVFMIVYIVGFPIMILTLLIWNRHLILKFHLHGEYEEENAHNINSSNDHHNGSQNQIWWLSFLFHDFKPKYYYYEFILLLRRISIGISILFSDNIAFAIQIMTLVLSLFFEFLLRPFKEKKVLILQSIVYMSLIFSVTVLKMDFFERSFIFPIIMVLIPMFAVLIIILLEYELPNQIISNLKVNVNKTLTHCFNFNPGSSDQSKLNNELKSIGNFEITLDNKKEEEDSLAILDSTKIGDHLEQKYGDKSDDVGVGMNNDIDDNIDGDKEIEII